MLFDVKDIEMPCFIRKDNEIWLKKALKTLLNSTTNQKLFFKIQLTQQRKTALDSLITTKLLIEIKEDKNYAKHYYK